MPWTRIPPGWPSQPQRQPARPKPPPPTDVVLTPPATPTPTTDLQPLGAAPVIDFSELVATLPSSINVEQLAVTLVHPQGFQDAQALGELHLGAARQEQRLGLLADATRRAFAEGNAKIVDLGKNIAGVISEQ